MKDLNLKTDPRVKAVFDQYPDLVRPKMLALRALILQTARDHQSIQTLEETLKWGEPSYLTKEGSTLRVDWKPTSPDTYCLYFKCTSRLIPTIREVYGDIFRYEKNRAIVFHLDDNIPLDELKDTIAMALQYHKVKNQPRLGR